MIHVSLVSHKKHGSTIWSLFDDSEMIAAFTVFQDHLLANGLAYETRRRYSLAVANFIDYLYEFGAAGRDSTITNIRLTKIIQDYIFFLRDGQYSGNPELAEYGRKLNKKGLTKNSFSPTLAAINKFLYICQNLADEACAMANIDTNFDNINLIIQQINGVKELSQPQRQKLIQSTMLGGVIRVTKTKLTRPRKISTPKKTSFDDEFLDFPLDRVFDLLNATRSYRDKALYSLLAASGLRCSEARALRIDDVDTQKLTIRVSDPEATRFGQNSQNRGNRFKGRTTSRVFLLEPFKTHFFKYLAEYIKRERINTLSSEYVFQCHRGKSKGTPFKEAADSTINEAFKNACMRADIRGHELNPDKVFTLHSLRHMYGVILLNYLELPDGKTLRMTEVQQLMGHKNISSTEKYARHDLDLLASKMEWANENINNGHVTEDLGQLFADSLRRRADKIQRKLVNS